MQSNDFHIGERVKAVYQETGLTPSEFSGLIGQARQNLQHVLGRQTMDTGLLLQISRVLAFDFFKEYSQLLEQVSSTTDGAESRDAKSQDVSAMEAELRFAHLALESARTEIKYLKEIVDLLRQRSGT